MSKNAKDTVTILVIVVVGLMGDYLYERLGDLLYFLFS